MTQKKSYSRYFIILQEDEKGYALGSDKLPSGYAKLEIKNDKCKISYYVQNLKKESAPYFMILICNKKDVKKIIKIGELNIDEHGRTEVSYEYPVENMANCNIGVDKIVGAGIVRFMNTNLISVMSGFTSTEIPEWKGFIVVEDENKRHDTEHKAAIEVKPEMVVIEKPAVIPEPILNEKAEEIRMEEKLPDNNIFEEYEMKIEEEKGAEEIKLLPIEEEEIEVNNEPSENLLNEDEYYNDEDSRHKKNSKKDKCEIKIEIECEDEKHHEKENCDHEHKHEHEKGKEDNFKGIIGDFFKELTDGFEELEGYFKEIKRCRWFKVPVHKLEDMHSCYDYNKHTVVYYPMINYYPYIGRHKHFILGYKFDKDNKMKYLVYGVPGRKAKIDQPFGGKSGFVTWVPLTAGEEEEYSMGYWLMFYDFKNSTIVIPVR